MIAIPDNFTINQCFLTINWWKWIGFLTDCKQVLAYSQYSCWHFQESLKKIRGLISGMHINKGKSVWRISPECRYKKLKLNHRLQDTCSVNQIPLEFRNLSGSGGCRSRAIVFLYLWVEYIKELFPPEP
jgi:hypothetical protein